MTDQADAWLRYARAAKNCDSVEKYLAWAEIERLCGPATVGQVENLRKIVLELRGEIAALRAAPPPPHKGSEE